MKTSKGRAFLLRFLVVVALFKINHRSIRHRSSTDEKLRSDPFPVNRGRRVQCEPWFPLVFSYCPQPSRTYVASSQMEKRDKCLLTTVQGLTVWILSVTQKRKASPLRERKGMCPMSLPSQPLTRGPSFSQPCLLSIHPSCLLTFTQNPNATNSHPLLCHAAQSFQEADQSSIKAIMPMAIPSQATVLSVNPAVQRSKGRCSCCGAWAVP